MTLEPTPHDPASAGASRCTGPKTDAGKLASSLNRVSHGMRSRTIVLPGEDAVAIHQQRDALDLQLGPVGPLEVSLVDSIFASIRGLERCRLQESAALGLQIAAAETRFVKERDDAAESLWRHFRSFDSIGYEKLAATFEGLEYLRVRWTALRNDLESRGNWNADDLVDALSYAGCNTVAAVHDPFALALAAAFAALDPGPNSDRQATRQRLNIGKIFTYCCDKDSDVFSHYIDRVHALRPEPGAAAAELRRLIAGQIEWLDERLVQRAAERDEALEAVRANGYVDLTPAGQLRLRYMTACERARGRSLRELQQLQNERRAREESETLNKADFPCATDTTNPRITPLAASEALTPVPHAALLPNELPSQGPVDATPVSVAASSPKPPPNLRIVADDAPATLFPAASIVLADCERTR